MEQDEKQRDRLLSMREALALGDMSDSVLRKALRKGYGPKAIKRPGSNRWKFWEREFVEWLNSGRVSPKNDGAQSRIAAELEDKGVRHEAKRERP
jgi:hypothetical protein